MQVDRVRLPDGRVVRPTEWSSTPLFTSVDIASGPLTPLDGFSYGRGGEIPGSVGPQKAVAVDTNFRGDGGVLQESEEIMIYSIMVEFFQLTDPDTVNDADWFAAYFAGNDAGVPEPPEVSAQNMLRIQRDTILELRIADTKEYLSHPIGFFPQSMGVAQTNGASRVVADPALADDPILGGNNGSVCSFDNRMIATPHHVYPGEAFIIRLKFPFGGINGGPTLNDNLNLGDDTNARIRARIYADGPRRRPTA